MGGPAAPLPTAATVGRRLLRRCGWFRLAPADHRYRQHGHGRTPRNRGSAGDGIGGGLYVATGAIVFLKKSHVTGNFAATSNDDIYGTVIYL